MTTRLEKLPDAEGEEKQDRPRLVSVKRTTGTERPKASLFEREARVCDANSEVQGASSEIKTVLRQVLPQNGKAILFGSQARGDAGENSDWDILILLDKQKLDATDYDEISYPLRELGWKMKACINPVMYTLKDWMKYSFSPFYYNVTKDGVELV